MKHIVSILVLELWLLQGTKYDGAWMTDDSSFDKRKFWKNQCLLMMGVVRRMIRKEIIRIIRSFR